MTPTSVLSMQKINLHNTKNYAILSCLFAKLFSFFINKKNGRYRNEKIKKFSTHKRISPSKIHSLSINMHCNMSPYALKC